MVPIRIFLIEIGNNKEATVPRFIVVKLKSSFQTFDGCYHDLVNPYGI
jgi:hypothetical protein